MSMQKHFSMYFCKCFHVGILVPVWPLQADYMLPSQGFDGSTSSNWNERPNAVAYGRLVVRVHLGPPTHATLKFNRLF
ncbi:hypothetical protein VNO80_02228 [Phaseolus coccineus]|uniref:Uncharacterized protein n=1 Tax=Phaseolus coccineus TaxID=3886 RepID=A0AAN9NPW7_PHACN